MPRQTYDKKTYQEKREKEMQGMKQTITHVMENYQNNPEELAELAQFSARFYVYSMRNQIIIKNQNQGASFVGSFEKFKQLGYSVKRGEHGMKIFVPAPLTLFRKPAEEDWIPISKAGEQEKQAIKNGEYETRKVMCFKIGSVFDISQTNCPTEDYPKIFHMGYSSEQHGQIYEALKSYCEQDLHCPVFIQDIKSISKRGFYTPSIHSITLNDRLEDTQKLSVLTHEMGHALLHQNDSSDIPVSEKELQADIVSMMLQTHFGIEIPDSRKAHLAEHYREYQKYLEQKKDNKQGSSLLECFQKANDVYKEHIEGMDAVVDQFLQKGNEMSMKIRPLTKEEQLYTHSQSMQIQGQTGYFGWLQGDFGKTGNEFFTDWKGKYDGENAEKFETELDDIVRQLQSREIGLLEDRNSMKSYFENHSESVLPDNRGFGLRVDTENNAYLFLCTPDGKDNFRCYCYESKWLDRHMEKAKEGIRFITPDYKEIFRIPDGGEIIITDVTGEQHEYACRYIDEAHLEVGNHLYHSCQFAELMERNGSVCEPKPEEQQPQTIEQSNMDQFFENYYQKQNGISYSDISTKANPQSDFEK